VTKKSAAGVAGTKGRWRIFPAYNANLITTSLNRGRKKEGQGERRLPRFNNSALRPPGGRPRRRRRQRRAPSSSTRTRVGTSTTRFRGWRPATATAPAGAAQRRASALRGGRRRRRRAGRRRRRRSIFNIVLPRSTFSIFHSTTSTTTAPKRQTRRSRTGTAD